jgi:carbonic anhydrase
MKRIVAFGVVAIVLVSATGCGGQDALVREFVASMNAFAETIEKKESREKQQAAADRVNATVEKINNLKLSDADKEALFKKHDAELKAATERVKKALQTQLMEGGTGVTPPNTVGPHTIK